MVYNIFMPKDNKSQWSELTNDMADKFVKAKLEGKSGPDARSIAGYSPKTKVAQIERAGGPVANKMEAALEKAGIDDSFLAQEYVEGIEMAKSDTAKKKDLGAHAQYLRQIGHILGYGTNKTPLVAVQINNESKDTPPDDTKRVGELVEQVSDLLEGLKEEISSRGDRTIHNGCSGTSASEPLEIVDCIDETEQ